MIPKKKQDKNNIRDFNSAKYLGQTIMLEPAEQICEVAEESCSEDSSNEQPTIATNVAVNFSEKGFSNRKSKRFGQVQPPMETPQTPAKKISNKMSFKKLSLQKKDEAQP